MNSDYQGKPTPDSSALAYHAFVQALAKPGADIIKSLTAEKADLLHAVIGISGEAGELLDAVKKYVIYEKPMTPELYANIIEELGDLRFYMQMVMNNLLIKDNTIMKANMEKLGKRYASLGYTDEQAQNRADKLGAAPIEKNIQKPIMDVLEVENTRTLSSNWQCLCPDGACLTLTHHDMVVALSKDKGWMVGYPTEEYFKMLAIQHFEKFRKHANQGRAQNAKVDNAKVQS